MTPHTKIAVISGTPSLPRWGGLIRSSFIGATIGSLIVYILQSLTGVFGSEVFTKYLFYSTAIAVFISILGSVISHFAYKRALESNSTIAVVMNGYERETGKKITPFEARNVIDMASAKVGDSETIYRIVQNDGTSNVMLSR